MALTVDEVRELERILQLRTHERAMERRRLHLAMLNKGKRISRPRKKGPPKLCVVVPTPRKAPPPGFEQHAIATYGEWKHTDDEATKERRFDLLWRLWLDWLKERCPEASTDVHWSFRYESPDINKLVDQLPDLGEEHRRRFGTKYCRLVRDHGKAVSA